MSRHRMLVLCLTLVVGCSESEQSGDEVVPLTPLASAPPFVELESPIFHHFNGMTGQYYIAEILGPGGALFDFDGDGDLDIFIVEGHVLEPGKGPSEAISPPRDQQPPRGRLFENTLLPAASAGEEMSFVDVTEQSGIQATGYGMGIAAGDFDNDGWVDLYLTNFGANQLWRNKGNGSFEDVTQRAGVDEGRWSASAAFVDFDRDGWLDLYVCNYVDFTLESHKPCYGTSSARDYCGPHSYAPVPDRLFRNRGNGTFEDATARAGLLDEKGAGLGVVCGDFNRDGWIDIYVANDGMANQCWMNLRNGAFRNEALVNGTAFNGGGAAEASMGVDAGDFDNDGDEDLFMSHLDDETNTFYENDGHGLFTDVTNRLGLAAPSRNLTGFGTSFLDYDGDGWLDLLAVNGAVKTIESLASRHDPFPLHQTNQLFRNLGDGRYVDISRQAGDAFQRSEVSRGAAFGDLDNDGDVDVLVLNNNGPARLLVNQVGNQQCWLGLRLLDLSGRDALGAWVTVTADGRQLSRRCRTAASYCSANDARVLFGLGETPTHVDLRVMWPDGAEEQWLDVTTRQYITIHEGQGGPVGSGM